MVNGMPQSPHLKALLMTGPNTLKPIFHCDAILFALGPGVGLDPQCHNFALEIPTCWYPKTLKFALPPTRILKFALAPTRNPSASQWNIGCVGSQIQNVCVGHVHFMFFVLISFAFGSQGRPSSSGIWA